MSEPFPPDAPPHHPMVRWRHALSNDINGLMMATSAARLMLEMGDVPAAITNLARAEASGRRCIDLLHRGPPTS